jgi:hypothetical protein
LQASLPEEKAMKVNQLLWAALLGVTPFVLGLMTQAHAAIGTNSYAGALLGASFMNSTTNFTVGAEGGYRLDPTWGVGGYLTYLSQGITVAGTSYNTSFTTLAAQGMYFFADSLDGLRVGLDAGLGFSSTNQPAASGSTGFIIGPMAGYDYILSNQISVGAEGDLLFNTASSSSANLQLFAAVKYWF